MLSFRSVRHESRHWRKGSITVALLSNLACGCGDTGAGTPAETGGNGGGGSPAAGAGGKGAAGSGGSGGSAGSAGNGGTPGAAGATMRALPWLHVDGNQIKDPSGNTVVLRGVSTIDLGATDAWEGGAIEMIDRLTNPNDTQGSSPGWYPTVIRLAIYPSDEEGFQDGPFYYDPNSDDYYETLLRPVVDHCRERGVYAIIDWHYIGDTSAHTATTAEFWTDMAPRFAGDSHVLFELFNEPVDDGNWTSVQSNMQSWYDIARAAAPNTLMLIGTPNWCQQPAETATNPLTKQGGGEPNVAYVAHMYPYHWNEMPEMRQDIITAAAAHPVFMSEWGFQQSNQEDDITNGTITSYGNPLKAFAEEHNLSWTAWCASRTWGPPIFGQGYNLRVGEGSMGGFLKDWLYETRNDDLAMGP